VAATILVATTVAAGCSGDDDPVGDGEPTATTAPDTLAPLPPGVDGPGGDIPTAPAEDPEFIERILADGEVTADELAAAYEAYIECLADGGGYGRYAFDVDLHAVLTVDWRIADDDEDDSQAATLDAGCSHHYLAGLDGAYFAVHPDADDLAIRQRDSIAACIEPISPEVAAAIPDEITVDTAGGGLYIGDPQFDAAFLGADVAETEAIGLCFSTIGAPWHEFGEPPPVTETTA
jgi:hypothetical protein